MGTAQGAPTAQPRPSVTPTAAATVTLPGYATAPAWSVRGVDAAAVSRQLVLTAQGSTVQWRAAVDGEVVATAEISGSNVRVLSGFVSGVSAAAAVSDTQALVWVDGAKAPLQLSLGGGRTLEVRAGTLFITGPDRTFWMVTSAGEIPVASPRPEAIVLGVAGDAVVWASAPHRVSVASPNGTVVHDAVLAPPAAGAVITPRTGWVRAVTDTTVVVGWTLPSGTQATSVHALQTGEAVAGFTGAGAGVLSPAGDVWVDAGHLLDLTDSTVTPLPDGFVASRFLGSSLYGATANGTDALLVDGAAEPVPAAATVRPFATSSDGMLLTLTSGELAAFTTAKN
ncbi:hypothetical protein [Microbacterium sp. NPDC055665]